MPWRETNVSHEKLKFIAECRDSLDSFTEICRRFGISRKTGYKWLDRYEEHGATGLVAQPRVARLISTKLDFEVERLIVETRKQHATWGPKKLRGFLEEKNPGLKLPAVSTFGEVLKRNGLLRARRRRPSVPLHPNPLVEGTRPNDLWCADYKGDFQLGNGQRCYPLTIMDGYSRFLLKCEGLPNVSFEEAKPHWERAFLEFGMPERIRTDNGAPFATRTTGGLSQLSVWMMKLGIAPERITPGQPQENGKQERMHRTLKAEGVQPVQQTMEHQQRVFDRFRAEYNEQRPHEALNQQPPAKLYVLSRRTYTGVLKSPEYGPEYEVRKVGENGNFRWGGKSIHATELLAGEPIGLRQLTEERWELYYGTLLLGWIERGEERYTLRRRTAKVAPGKQAKPMLDAGQK